MSQRFTRSLGLGLAASVGLLLLYLGWSTTRPKHKAVTNTAVVQKTQPPMPKDHELKMLQVELQRKPGHVPVLFRLAQLSEESGHQQDAIRYLREALKTEPSNSDALLELGKVLYDSGDIGGALEQTKKVLDKTPNQPDALYNMGALYANVGNSDLARQYWQQLVKADPQSESGQKAKESLARLSAQAH